MNVKFVKYSVTDGTDPLLRSINTTGFTTMKLFIILFIVHKRSKTLGTKKINKIKVILNIAYEYLLYCDAQEASSHSTA